MSIPSEAQILPSPPGSAQAPDRPLPPLPPGGGGGGGRGDGPAFGSTPYESGPPIPAAKLAMMVFLGSVTMLFVGLMGAYLVLRGGLTPWPPPGMPPRPVGLWGSTALIGMSSLMLLVASRRLRRDAQQGFRLTLVLTAVFGVAFLVVQVILWRSQFAAGLQFKNNVYAGVFYLLTGAHFIHVVGGVVALAGVGLRAFRGGYRSQSRVGFDVFSLYWHTIGVLWLPLFAAIYLVN